MVDWHFIGCQFKQILLFVSALEVFLKRYALYKFTFYLLTYLLFAAI